MTYEEFMNAVIEQLKENYPEANIEETHVEKLQGQSYDGISISENSTSMKAVYDMHPYYQKMQQGEPIHVIVERIQDSYHESRQRMFAGDMSMLGNYETMKAFLTVQLIPQKGNEGRLKEIPHKRMEDLALVYRMQLPWDKENSSLLLSNENLKVYGITPEQLHEDALIYAPVNEAPSLKNMSAVLAGMMGLEEEPDSMPLYVATVQSRYHGASVISYPGFLDEAVKELGGDYYILPSSVHECLLLKDDGNVNIQDLKELVTDVNQLSVPPEDRLSDNVYHYDSKEKLFEIAEVFEARKQQEMDVVKLDEEQQNENNKQEVYRVLLVEPNDYPKVVEIGTALEDLQQAVEGSIQVIYPYDEQVCLIMNEEGKINGMPLNRCLRDDDGDIYDIVAGPMLVAGLSGESFASLTKEQIAKYEKLFHQPEIFARMGKSIMALPMPDEMVEKARERSAQLTGHKGTQKNSQER